MSVVTPALADRFLREVEAAHLTPRTRRAYGASVEQFRGFCVQAGYLDPDSDVLVCAAREEPILAYAAWLIHPNGSGLTSGTVFSKISAIRKQCLTAGVDWPMDTPRAAARLKDVVKGGEALAPLADRVPTRGAMAPLYPAVLLDLLQNHADAMAPTEALVFPAVALSCLATLVRAGNVVPPAVDQLDVSHLLYDNVVYVRGSHFVLKLARTKTGTKPVSLVVAKTLTPHAYNPYDTLKRYHAWRIQHYDDVASYFVDMTGRVFTTSALRAALRQLAVSGGLASHRVGTHSLRHGATQALREADVPECDVVALGAWRSRGTHHRYLAQPSVDHIRGIQTRMFAAVGTRGARPLDEAGGQRHN